MRPFLVAAMLCLAIAACGDGPTAPDPLSSPPDGPLTPGRYLLSVGSVPDQLCTGRLDSWGLAGPVIGGTLALSADGDGWIGRALPPEDGDIELRLRATGTGANVSFSGSLRGRVNHFLDRLFTAPPRAVVFAGASGSEAAGFTGSRLPSVAAVFGNVTGEITFAHPSGTTVTCSQVFMFLDRSLQQNVTGEDR